MKIVNRKTFLSLPSGTVFAKYRPCVFEDLLIKGESLLETSDFFYQQILDSIDCDNSDEFVMKLDAAHNDGISIDMNFEVQNRDGLYDEDQLFAVWEDKDIIMLITRLQKARIGRQ